MDTTPLFVGLEGDLCQCPYWGYLIKGQLGVTDADCKEEVVYSKDLFYWPSGLNIKVNEGAEIIMFSPQEEHTHVINHMIYNLEKDYQFYQESRAVRLIIIL